MHSSIDTGNNKTRLRFVVFAVLAGFVLVAQPASAQIDGIPVYFNPKGGTGITLAGDYGRGVNDDSGKNNTFAARAILGVSAFSIGAGIGRQDSVTQYAGVVAVRVFGGALLPFAVSLQAGLGFQSVGEGATETTTYNVPIGIGFGLNIPTPGFLFEPWIAPRFSVNRLEVGGQSENKTGFGLSAGVRLGFAMGLALHAGVDWADLDAPTFVPGGATESQPMTIGVGFSYTIRLPGLGVPGVPGL